LIRLRFAPSPTGNLHIGSLRTALFNWIFARNQKGIYVLRIEDTDQQRSEKKYEENIFAGLTWTGLEADESPIKVGEYGPYRQSERMQQGIYKKYAEKLLEAGHAYYCFCSDKELDEEREQAKKANLPYVYSRKCANLSKEEIESKKSQGIAYVIKFRMPENELVYKDLVRDDIHFDLKLFSDFVLIKSDKSPSYNFAVVIDDMLMGITHVIRGEDHISNTPKQICVYNALGQEVPQFAHLPMILGPDKSKLSKRHGATSVIEYQAQGFLPEALFNYLVLLGWSPPDEREIMTREEIISLFSLDRISKSGAVFDITKLKWMNGQYIRKFDEAQFYEIVLPYVSQENLAGLSKYSPEKLAKILFSVRDNLDILSEINNYLEVYIDNFEEYKKNISELNFSEQELDVLQTFKSLLQDFSSVLDRTEISNMIDSILASKGLGKGKVMKPVRFACAGRKSGPDLFEFLSILGKETLLERLEYLL
jgi:nondiscriminating glutamyl-tRNA synthetase